MSLSASIVIVIIICIILDELLNRLLWEVVRWSSRILSEEISICFFDSQDFLHAVIFLFLCLLQGKLTSFLLLIEQILTHVTELNYTLWVSHSFWNVASRLDSFLHDVEFVEIVDLFVDVLVGPFLVLILS